MSLSPFKCSTSLQTFIICIVSHNASRESRLSPMLLLLSFAFLRRRLLSFRFFVCFSPLTLFLSNRQHLSPPPASPPLYLFRHLNFLVNLSLSYPSPLSVPHLYYINFQHLHPCPLPSSRQHSISPSRPPLSYASLGLQTLRANTVSSP